jgi:hypothetical protein
VPIFRRDPDRPHPILAQGAVSVAPRPKPSGPTPEEELPDWVMASALEFLAPFFAGRGPHATGDLFHGASTRNFVREVETRFHIALSPQDPAEALWRQVQQDRALLAQVLDFALSDLLLGYEGMEIADAVGALSRALTQGGANYEVVRPDPQYVNCRLQRRTTPTATAALRAQTAVAGNASTHLDSAWKAAFGPRPDPSAAYREAVKAVEAAAIPVVTPNNKSATLGTIIGELRANPQKFSVAFARGASPARGGTPLDSIEVVITMCDWLWKNQTDRHGVGEAEPIVAITSPQAEMALHVALTLVHTFRSAIT